MIVSNSSDRSPLLPSVQAEVELYVALDNDMAKIREYERARPWQYVDGEDFQPSVLAAYEAAANQLAVTWSAFYYAFKQVDQLYRVALSQLNSGLTQEAVDAIVAQQTQTVEAGNACKNDLSQSLTALSAIKAMDDTCGRWSSAKDGEPEQVFAQFAVRSWPAI